MKMEVKECSETSAYKIMMPGNYPEDNIHHPQHGESLKTTIRRNEFAANILEGAISGKKGCRKTSTTILKANRQKHRS
jgi:hypothetical protein